MSISAIHPHVLFWTSRFLFDSPGLCRFFSFSSVKEKTQLKALFIMFRLISIPLLFSIDIFPLYRIFIKKIHFTMCTDISWSMESMTESSSVIKGSVQNAGGSVERESWESGNEIPLSIFPDEPWENSNFCVEKKRLKMNFHFCFSRFTTPGCAWLFCDKFCRETSKK